MNDDWQIIETAPKDKEILLYRGDTFYEWAKIVTGKWDDDRFSEKPRPYWTHYKKYLTGTTEVRKYQPTHWMPLPDPPKD